MATMIYFDTLHYVETLQEAGFSAQQAKAFAKVQQESLSESLDTTLATKADMAGVKSEMNNLRVEMSDLRTGMSDLRTEVKTEIQSIWSEVRLLRWMMGTCLAGIGTLILKSFF